MFQMLMTMMVRVPLQLIGSMIYAYIIISNMFPVLATASVLVIAGVVVILVQVAPLFKVVQKKLDKINTVLQENLAGVRLVKSFNRAKYEEGRFGSANDDFMNISTEAGVKINLMGPFMMLIMNLSIVVVMWIAGKKNHRQYP